MDVLVAAPHLMPEAWLRHDPLSAKSGEREKPRELAR
jgi:hypothetical protein